MTVPVASLVFGIRRADKAENGDFGSWAVATGQGTKFVNGLAQCESPIGKKTQSVLDYLKDASKSEKLLDYAGKGLKWTSEHVNPLIIGVSALDTITSDDPASAFVTNTTALSAMFAAEHVMKTKVKEPMMNSIMDMAKASKHAKVAVHAKTVAGVVYDVAFLGASIGSYCIGNKIGEALLGKEDKNKYPPQLALV